MGRLFGIALALLVLGMGVRHIAKREAGLVAASLFFDGDDNAPDDDGPRVSGWPAVLIGAVEVAAGLWMLRTALHG